MSRERLKQQRDALIDFGLWLCNLKMDVETTDWRARHVAELQALYSHREQILHVFKQTLDTVQTREGFLASHFFSCIAGFQPQLVCFPFESTEIFLSQLLSLQDQISTCANALAHQLLPLTPARRSPSFSPVVPIKRPDDSFFSESEDSDALLKRALLLRKFVQKDALAQEINQVKLMTFQLKSALLSEKVLVIQKLLSEAEYHVSWLARRRQEWVQKPIPATAATILWLISQLQVDQLRIVSTLNAQAVSIQLKVLLKQIRELLQARLGRNLIYNFFVRQDPRTREVYQAALNICEQTSFVAIHQEYSKIIQGQRRELQPDISLTDFAGFGPGL